MLNVRSYSELVKLLNSDERKLVQTLIELGLLKLGKCPTCRRFRVHTKHPLLKSGYGGRCPKCRRFKCLTQGTFFEKTHVLIKKILEIMYCWAKDMSIKDAVSITGINRNAVNQYFRYCRDVDSWKIIEEEDSFKYGGPGHIVQIDERVMARRKNNRGRVVQEKWVLGILDATKKEGLVIYVPKRNAETLLPIIERHVLKESEIRTDQWRAYNNLSNMGYIHKTVNHSKNFKDPKSGVCTNGVEGFWGTMKRYLRKKCVQSSINISEQIDEYMWRKLYIKKGENAFKHIAEYILNIAERYK